MKLKRLTLIILLGLMTVTTSFAQDQQDSNVTDDEGCPVLVEQALDLTKRNCEVVGNNQICYGHSTLEAAARPNDETFKFDEPGDVEDVIQMQSLRLSGMDVAQQLWGVILMQVQAGLKLSDQENVTFVVFGDTELQAPLNLLETSTLSASEIYRYPDASAEIVGSVDADQVIQANGVFEDGEWIRVQLSEDSLITGWMPIEQTTVKGDIALLETVTQEDLENPLANFGPMQAFYFESGVDDAPCNEAPNSGLMIQTPEGAANVTLWIDEVIIELNATAFVQASADGSLIVNVIEGTADVTANGESQTAIAGTQVRVALDESLGAVGVPSVAQPFDPEDLQSLPVDLLPETVEIPEPETITIGVPTAGSWRFSWGVDELTCPDGTVVPFESSGSPSIIEIADGGATILWGGAGYSWQSDGVYTRSYVDINGNLYQDTMIVISPTSIAGESIIDFAATICTLTVPFNLDFSG